jgi:hypothetical protein
MSSPKVWFEREANRHRFGVELFSGQVGRVAVHLLEQYKYQRK